jgi:hypothetical protein
MIRRTRLAINRSKPSHVPEQPKSDDILPWEAKGISLVVLLSTARLLVFHPYDAFGMTFVRGYKKARFFFLIMVCISSFFTLCYSVLFSEMPFWQAHLGLSNTEVYKLTIETLGGFVLTFFRTVVLNSIIGATILYPLQALYLYVALRVILVRATISWLYKIALYLEVCSLIYLLPLPQLYLDYAHTGWVYLLLGLAIVRTFHTSWVKALAIVFSWVAIIFAPRFMM